MKRRFKIQDRFTNMKKADGTPMSRQQIHMLRKRARGLCWICSQPALEGGYFCLEHQIQARERMRKKLGCRRRNLGATSYKLKNEEAEARSKRQAAQARRANSKTAKAKSAQSKSKVAATKAKAKTAKAKTTKAKTVKVKGKTKTKGKAKAPARKKAKTLPRTTRKAVARN